MTTLSFEESVIREDVQTLTKRQIAVLRRLEAEGDLVLERGSAWIGYEKTSPRTVMALLRVCAIKMELGSEVGRCERYEINGTGKEILRRLEAQE